jgi:hypothetical protein
MILLVLDLIQILGLTGCFSELASRVFGLGCSHVKVKLKNNKDLLVGSFYMPHREQKHLDELRKSLEKN